MRVEEIVDLVADVVEDQDAALALPNGTTALAVKEAVAAELADHPVYSRNWARFEASPQAQRPVLVGVLQVVLTADVGLAERLDALMTQYKQGQPTTTVIRTEGAYIGGSVTVQGGDFVGRDQVKTITTYQGADPAAIARAFAEFYAQVSEHEALSPEDRADVRAELQEVEEELQKGEAADEGFIRRRLRNVQRMAPDILEVVLTTFANPVLGLGMVAKKIAAKMKAEADPAAAPSGG